MEQLIQSTNLVGLLIKATVGLVLFSLSFKAITALFPGNFWHEILEEKNTAMGIVGAGLSVALALLISNTI